MKLSRSEAKSLIPSLAMVISMLQARGGQASNTVRYRAERLRNRIIRGESVDSQDFKDIEVSVQRLPTLEKIYRKSQPFFVIKMFSLILSLFIVSCGGKYEVVASGTATINNKYSFDFEVCDKAPNPSKKWECVDRILKLAERQADMGCIIPETGNKIKVE